MAIMVLSVLAQPITTTTAIHKELNSWRSVGDDYSADDYMQH